MVTAYNDTRVQVVQQVEGRYQRWGNQVEYDIWAAEYTWLGGRSAAIAKIGAGESVTVPVVVTNRSHLGADRHRHHRPARRNHGGLDDDVVHRPCRPVRSRP